jgi:hypothetical protein
LHVWAAKKPYLEIDCVNQFLSRELEELGNLNVSLSSMAQLATGKPLPEVHGKL